MRQVGQGLINFRVNICACVHTRDTWEQALVNCGQCVKRSGVFVRITYQTAGTAGLLEFSHSFNSSVCHNTLCVTIAELTHPLPIPSSTCFPCKPMIQINKTIKPINLSSCLTNLVPSVLHAVANFRFPYHGHFKSVPDSLCHVKEDLDLVWMNISTDVDIYHTFCAYSDCNILFSCIAADIRAYIKVSAGLYIPKSSLWEWKPWALQGQKATKPCVQTNAFFLPYALMKTLPYFQFWTALNLWVWWMTVTT